MRLLRRFKYLLHRNRRERELAEELAFHRALAERERRESGLTPEAARRAAGNWATPRWLERRLTISGFPALLKAYFRICATRGAV